MEVVYESSLRRSGARRSTSDDHTVKAEPIEEESDDIDKLASQLAELEAMRAEVRQLQGTSVSPPSTPPLPPDEPRDNQEIAQSSSHDRVDVGDGDDDDDDGDDLEVTVPANDKPTPTFHRVKNEQMVLYSTFVFSIILF